MKIEFFFQIVFLMNFLPSERPIDELEWKLLPKEE